MMWRPGKRDVWSTDGNRVAEIVQSDWKSIVHLIAAAPELLSALEDMVRAYETKTDVSVSTRMTNDRSATRARDVIRKARGKD